MEDWRSAYFAQARSDFDVFNHLKEVDEIPLCQTLHYLQMATEKLAKGFLTERGRGPYGRTHDAFRRFVQTARQRPEFLAALGIGKGDSIKNGRDEFLSRYFSALAAKAAEIENLSPEGDDHPNPEYPWKDTDGNIISPLDFEFTSIDYRKSARMRQLIEFIEKCFVLAQ